MSDHPTAQESDKRNESKVKIDIIRISESEKLTLAKWLLLGIAILFLFGSISLLKYGEPGVKIFETFKVILPPIATLIIGYYFSDRSKRKL